MSGRLRQYMFVSMISRAKRLIDFVEQCCRGFIPSVVVIAGYRRCWSSWWHVMIRNHVTPGAYLQFQPAITAVWLVWPVPSWPVSTGFLLLTEVRKPVVTGHPVELVTGHGHGYPILGKKRTEPDPRTLHKSQRSGQSMILNLTIHMSYSWEATRVNL